MARQPIFDRWQRLFAYEILFRSGPDNVFTDSDSELATSRVISDLVHVFGLDKLTAGTRAFINMPRKNLIEGWINILPPGQTVVELLETVEPDEEVLDACRSLKRAGYILALDDFILRAGYEPLIKLADILKIDFLQTTNGERRSLARRFGSGRPKLLAEKVETRSDFLEAREAGYAYFQGYFFCRPEVLSKREIPAFKRNYLRLLSEVNRPDLDTRRLEPIIRQDVSLTVKLLRYLNSAFFGFQTPISSIRHAIVVLGEDAIRRWASLVALTCVGEDKPVELIVLSLLRGRFCEEVAGLLPARVSSQDAFIMGMLSTLDALVDQPLEEVLQDLSLSPQVKSALLGDRSPLGLLLSLSIAYERGLWDDVEAMAGELSLSATDLPEPYRQSVEWAGRVFRG